MDDQADEGQPQLVKGCPGYCSFCRKSREEIGPLVEGRDYVSICYLCLKLCESVFVQEYARRGLTLPELDISMNDRDDAY